MFICGARPEIPHVRDMTRKGYLSTLTQLKVKLEKEIDRLIGQENQHSISNIHPSKDDELGNDNNPTEGLKIKKMGFSFVKQEIEDHSKRLKEFDTELISSALKKLELYEEFVKVYTKQMNAVTEVARGSKDLYGSFVSNVDYSERDKGHNDTFLSSEYTQKVIRDKLSARKTRPFHKKYRIPHFTYPIGMKKPGYISVSPRRNREQELKNTSKSYDLFYRNSKKEHKHFGRSRLNYFSFVNFKKIRQREQKFRGGLSNPIPKLMMKL